LDKFLKDGIDGEILVSKKDKKFRLIMDKKIKKGEYKILEDKN
jgi:hypothetical protein